jgi:hypothetical protein
MGQFYLEPEQPASTSSSYSESSQDTEAERDELGSLSFQDSDQMRLYEEIRQTREALRPILEAQLNQKLTTPPATLVLAAAEQMLKAISMLAHDDNFWTRIEDGEGVLGQATVGDILTVSTILEADLVGILDLMDYRPPPPSLTLAHELQTAFHQVIHDPTRALREDVAHQARYHAAVFAYHLRPLIDAAQDARPNSHDGRLLRRRMLAAVRAGAPAVIAATIATGITALVFPVPGAAEAAGILSTAVLRFGSNEAIEELTKRGIEMAALTVLTNALQGEVAGAEPQHVFQAATDSLIHSTEQLAGVAADVLEDESLTIDPTFRAMVIEATRCYFEFERSRILLDTPGRSIPSHRAAAALAGALHDLRDWTSQPQDSGWPEIDGREQLADAVARLELATEQLRPYGHH